MPPPSLAQPHSDLGPPSNCLSQAWPSLVLTFRVPPPSLAHPHSDLAHLQNASPKLILAWAHLQAHPDSDLGPPSECLSQAWPSLILTWAHLQNASPKLGPPSFWPGPTFRMPPPSLAQPDQTSCTKSDQGGPTLVLTWAQLQNASPKLGPP